MHARVTTIEVGPEEPDSVAAIFEQILPTMRSLDGYLGLLVLDEPDRTRFLVVSLWESAEALEASEPTAARIVAAETAGRDFRLESMKRYRVDSFDLPK